MCGEYVSCPLNPSRSQGFTYDSLNRIGSFSLGGTLKEQYSTDSFGNMTQMAGGNPVNTFDTATNRVNLSCGSVPFDAAGNQRCSTNALGAITQYVYDADSRIASINALNGGASTTYTYGGDGARVLKSNADGSYTEYVAFNGQTIAELNHTPGQPDGWTDYVYAGGKKIASVPGVDNRIHTHGVFTTNWNELRWNLPTPKSANGANYTVKSGDKLCFRQYNSNAVGGPVAWFSNGVGTAWAWQDTNGVTVNQMYTANAWVPRCADLTLGGSTTGTQIATLALLTDVYTPPGTWDIWYADMSIISADGTVISIIGSQRPTPAYGDFQGSGWTGTPTAIAESVPRSADPTVTAGGQNAAAMHFYLADHLGTAQMEFAAGGWPVWQGQFAPFGGELHNGVAVAADQPDTTTANHYKFTGKERDAESGLDYFGARYYGSSMGRFMSPDPFLPFNQKPEQFQAWIANPQHWNKYAYVLNNPLKYTDPTGMTETIYYFLSKDATDAQRKFFNDHKDGILGAIGAKLKEAGIKDVVFKDGASLSAKQVSSILANKPTGVGLLNFANTSFSGYNAPSGNYGAPAQDGRSAVFVGNLQVGQYDGDALAFRVSEVGSHELGHRMGFYSRGAMASFMEFWNHDLMNEGQGVPTLPEHFDMSIPQNQKIVNQINQTPEYKPN